MIPDQYYLTLFDLAKRTQINKYFSLYKHTLNWSAKDVKKYQFEKIKKLLTHAYNHTIFYRNLFEKNNLTPDSIKSISDLNLIPPLSRENVRNNYQQLLSNNIKVFSSKSSSGTTGIPILYSKDVNGYSAGMAAGYFQWYLSGWNFGQRRIHIWGNQTSVKNWNRTASRFKRKLFHTVNIDSTRINDENNLNDIIKIINEFKPEIIDGYPSAIYQLAAYIKANNIILNKSKVVFTTGENLLSTHSEVISEVLGATSDTYGCGEINGVAVKPVNDLNYYIIEPHVYVETLSNHNNEFNEILITDLDNFAMPLIRYKIGDLIDNIYESNSKLKIPYAYFKQLFGRSTDIINLPGGKTILPINILGGTLFRNLRGIIQHKVTWDGSLLNFYFKVNNEYSSELTQSAISTEFKDFNINFNINIVDDIPISKSGKLKYFEILE